MKVKNKLKKSMLSGIKKKTDTTKKTKMGKIIVIEGCDGTGKATQSKKIVERLMNEGKKSKRFEFPSYGKKSGLLIEMFINGQMVSTPDQMPIMVPSSYFAIDRYIVFKDEIKPLLEKGYTIICDRWTTANLLHQTAKIKDLDEKEKVKDWIKELEYEKFGLPKPDLTLYLDLTEECMLENIRKRMEKNEQQVANDIYERDLEYQKASNESGRNLAKVEGWHIIDCSCGSSMKTIDEIHEVIMKEVYDVINK